MVRSTTALLERGAEGSASDEAAVEADQPGRARARSEASTFDEGSASDEAATEADQPCHAPTWREASVI